MKQSPVVPLGLLRSASALAARLLLTVLLVIVAAVPVVAATVTAQTQPADIAQLRQRQDLDVLQLRDLALRERQSASGLRLGWATLALAEFENDLEHAEQALPLLEKAEQVAIEHHARDLLFEVRIRRSVVLVNRGKTAETDVILSGLQALVEEAGSPQHWRAQLLHERGVLERKLGRFDRSLAFSSRRCACSVSWTCRWKWLANSTQSACCTAAPDDFPMLCWPTMRP